MPLDNPRVALALDRAMIAMLTAVDGRGQPQTAPVWFLRERDTLVVYNQPSTPRLRSIASNPRVSLALRGDREARGAVVMEGRAEVAGDVPSARDHPDYLEKYREEIERLGWTPETFTEDYSVGIRIVIDRVRSWGIDDVLEAEEEG